MTARTGLAALLSTALVALCLGCGASPSNLDPRQNPDRVLPDPSAGPVARSDKLRDTNPEVDPTELAELARGNAAFAMELFHKVSDEPGNLFLSPYSVSMALAMTYAGARTQTETEMEDTLHFTLGRQRLHPAFNAVDLAIESRGQGASAADGKAFRLHTANALWAQIDLPFLLDYLDTLALNYDAGVRLLDYVADPELARATINAWVNDQTEQRIPELLGFGSVTEMTRLVLTNTIYFNAAWANEFAPEATRDGPFQLVDGGSVSVPMMSAPMATHGYLAEDGYQAVELPYDGGELSMVVVLPDAGQFDSVTSALDGDGLLAIFAGLEPTTVNLHLPRWASRSKLSLGRDLAELGMPSAFGDADFSAITGSRDLVITGVLHEAFVTVDEAGTEAGAATAVIMAGGMPDVVFVDVNRPFIFVIRDIATNAILFVGRVINPAG